MCSKVVKDCHKNISCQKCNGYVHKKCTKLKPKELNNLDPKEWICSNCIKTSTADLQSDIEDDIQIRNDIPQLNVTEVDLQKYDKMIFNPLRFDNDLTDTNYSDITNNAGSHVCSYSTPEQFCSDINTNHGKFNVLNLNIRSLSKNFEKLKECIKNLDCEFTVIGISETHLKDKPHNYYNLPGYKIEYMNRIGREKGGVCMYVSEKVKYKLRKDLCHATSNFESCFIEIENVNKKNIAIGVVYRAHTPIDNFVADIDPLFKKLNAENKHIYVMGVFNIDLLKVDSHRPTHEYLELIYSYHLVPTIYKPTRITKSTATIIDNILTNNENIVSSTIVVTDTSDHMPTVLSTNLNITKQSSNTNKFVFKRKHSNANVDKFRKKLSEVKWEESLHNNNANDDFNKFTNIFEKLYDECIPLKKCTANRRKEPMSPWITKGILKSINKKNKLYK
jgi:hypothetical protein